MLDSEGFVKAGWVHDMVLHRFSEEKFIVKGKVGTLMVKIAVVVLRRLLPV